MHLLALDSIAYASLLMRLLIAVQIVDGITKASGFLCRRLVSIVQS